MEVLKHLIVIVCAVLCLTGCEITVTYEEENPDFSSHQTNEMAAPTLADSAQVISLDDIPAYSGNAYITIHDNIPSFTDDDITATSYEYYSELDELGRCGVTIACIGTDLMPTEERGSISSIKPTGWKNKEYDFVDGRYVYNRCHLIGYQLTAENANKQNLITGTRYLNIEGMLPFENMTADYIKETQNHVLYRVTPLFDGDNLVASGVLMEGWSVEDEGEGICFNVFCYNVQPGVTIDYATGENHLSESSEEEDTETYLLNTNSHKFHLPDCSSISSIKEEYRAEYTGNRSDLISQGYEPCKRCNP